MIQLLLQEKINIYTSKQNFVYFQGIHEAPGVWGPKLTPPSSVYIHVFFHLWEHSAFLSLWLYKTLYLLWHSYKWNLSRLFLISLGLYCIKIHQVRRTFGHPFQQVRLSYLGSSQIHLAIVTSNSFLLLVQWLGSGERGGKRSMYQNLLEGYSNDALYFSSSQDGTQSCRRASHLCDAQWKQGDFLVGGTTLSQFVLLTTVSCPERG